MGNASLDGNFPFIPFIPSIPSEKISCWAFWINVDRASLNSLSSLNSLNSLYMSLNRAYPEIPRITHSLRTKKEETMRSLLYLVWRLVLVNLDVLTHSNTLVDDYLGCLVEGVIIDGNLVDDGVLLDLAPHTLI